MSGLSASIWPCGQGIAPGEDRQVRTGRLVATPRAGRRWRAGPSSGRSMADAGGEVACSGVRLAVAASARRASGPAARHRAVCRGRPGFLAAPRGVAIAGPSGTAGVPAQFRVALQARDVMPEVLRSIGFDPAPADEEFVARCQSALDVVKHDLDVTGYGQYRMRARFGGWPASVYPTMPDGSYWGRKRGHVPRGQRFLAAVPCGRLGLGHAQGDTRDRVASVCRPRRSSGLDLGRRGTRRPHRQGGMVALHQHRACASPVGQLTAKIAKTF